MSHFGVLVTVPQGKTLEQVMMPYHEYECTGIKEYLQFVPCNQEELLKDYAEHGDGRPLVEFAEDWGGYKFDPDTQKWGSMTNPNKQWDWYEVGGRWSKALSRTSGKVSDFNFEKERARRIEAKLKTFAEWHTARDAANPGPKDIESAKSTLTDHWAKYEPAQMFYGEDALKLALDSAAFDAVDWHMWGVNDAQLLHAPEADYIAIKMWEPPFHAFIALDGSWHERGNMGWFGMCNDENQNAYDGEMGEFWTFVNSLPADVDLYVVDCHI